MSQPTVGIYTLGCKVNQYESEAIAERFEANGFSVLPPTQVCDVYVVNTCTVTAESDRKSRQFIRRAVARNPRAYVLVTGCLSQTAPETVSAIEGVDYVCGNGEALPLPLSTDEENEMLRLLSEEQEKERARTALIQHNLRLVVYIARKFENTGVDNDDLVSIGTIGLIKAINSFRVDKNIKLATYASRCIENEILMYLRRTARLKSEISFDEPLNTDFEGNELLLSDVLGTPADSVYGDVEAKAERELLKEALKKLSERERKIMFLRFGLGGGEEMTQKDVADLLGISQSYISRLEKKIILRLKKEIAKMEQKLCALRILNAYLPYCKPFFWYIDGRTV